MRESNLCDRIIKLDRSIRFAGIVNNRGEVIEGGFKKGIEPLLNGTEEQRMYIHSLSNVTILQSYNDRLGTVCYSLTEHEKVILMTFPFTDGILCLSAMPNANMNKIRDKGMKVLKSIHNSSTHRRSASSNKSTQKNNINKKTQKFAK